MLDLSEWIIVVFSAALGLTWALFATVCAFTLNVPTVTPDPLGLLRGILLWPVVATFLLGSFLARVGGYHDTDILGLMLVVGVGVGLLCGLLCVLASRRYAFL